MSDFYAGDAGVVDERGTIITDAACRKCSYNLRGLQQDGRCPECGTPAGVSLHGELLRYSDPAWLKTVATGMRLILWGLLISIVMSLFTSLLAQHAPAIAGLLDLLAMMVGVVGAWKMTTPDPSGIGESDGLNARKLVRIAVVATVIGGVWNVVASPSMDAFRVATLVAMVFSVIMAIGEFAKLHFIQLLAARLPDDAMAKRAWFLKWGLGVCYVVLSVAGFAFALLGPAPIAGPAFFVLLAVLLPTGLTLLVFWIMSIFLIYHMKVAVQQQIPLSHEVWSREAVRRESAAADAPPLPSDSAAHSE